MELHSRLVMEMATSLRSETTVLLLELEDKPPGQKKIPRDHPNRRPQASVHCDVCGGSQ